MDERPKLLLQKRFLSSSEMLERDKLRHLAVAIAKINQQQLILATHLIAVRVLFGDK